MDRLMKESHRVYCTCRCSTWPKVPALWTMTATAWSAAPLWAVSRRSKSAWFAVARSTGATTTLTRGEDTSHAWAYKYQTFKSDIIKSVFLKYVCILGGSPAPHPSASRPHFVCTFCRQGSTEICKRCWLLVLDVIFLAGALLLQRESNRLTQLWRPIPRTHAVSHNSAVLYNTLYCIILPLLEV